MIQKVKHASYITVNKHEIRKRMEELRGGEKLHLHFYLPSTGWFVRDHLQIKEFWKEAPYLIELLSPFHQGAKKRISSHYHYHVFCFGRDSRNLLATISRAWIRRRPSSSGALLFNKQSSGWWSSLSTSYDYRRTCWRGQFLIGTPRPLFSASATCASLEKKIT